MHVHEHVDVHVDEVAAVSVLVAKGSYEGDERRFVRELGPLLEGGAPVVYVDLDGADLLSDGVARDLRRARAALEHEGRKLVVVAQRAGVLRWLERVGLAGEIAVVRKGEVPR